MTDGEHKQALPAGYGLQGYRLVRLLGVGGFGVTYLAEDVRLGRSVAIKEYLPNEFAVRAGEAVHPKSRNDQEDFEWGLARFLDEARTLARFRHPNLVQVLDYFEVNQTAYIVMNYEEGESLDRVLEHRGTLSEAQLKRLLLPIVDGLKEVHAAGYLHRDIKPSNVFIRRSDESPVLLDFGSARQALGRKSKSLTAVASAGYSPPEQYESEGEQGPWTDIYALSALCYRAITGTAPMEAPRRMSQLIQRRADPLVQLANERPNGYPHALLVAVDEGLELAPSDRPSSLDRWAEELARVELSPVPERGAFGRTSGRDAAQTVAVSGNSQARMDLDPDTPRGPAGMEFVWVPPGSFRIGSRSSEAFGDEQPLTQVQISEGFWLGKHPVTQAEWEAVMGANPSRFSGCERCPVERVSWEDVQEFVGKLNSEEGHNQYQLPTEAEWEYAARAGTTGDRYGSDLGNLAWYDSNSGKRTHPVGLKAPNAWGLYDMLGNVWEWVADWCGAYLTRSLTDPSGPTSGSGRVIRGGSWNNSARFVRASFRSGNRPADRHFSLGLRLVRTR